MTYGGDPVTSPESLNRSKERFVEGDVVPLEGDHVLAWALYKNGLCAEARRVSLRSFRLGTLDVDGLYHHALIEECLGDHTAAARYRTRVASLAPRYLEAAPSARRLAPPR